MRVLQVAKAERLFSKGQKLLKSGNIELAIDSFEQTLSVDPKYARVYLHKTIALSQMKQYEEAVTSLNKAIDLAPSNPAFPMFVGIVRFDQGKYKHALRAFDKSLSITEKNALALSYKGLTLICLERFDEGFELLKESIADVNSEFQSRLLLYCEKYLLQNEDLANSLDEAISKESEALQPSGTFKTYLTNLTNGIGKILDTTEFVMLYMSLSVWHILQPKKRKAYSYYVTGEKERYAGNLDAAIEAYKKTLESFPDLDEAKAGLGEVYLEKDEYDEALKYADGIREENRDNPVYHMLLGLASYKLNKFDEAIEEFNLVIENFPDGYEPFYYLGLCHLAKEDEDQARKAFARATDKINPGIAKKRLAEVTRIHHILREKESAD